ncbi:MgtC/SapB family protein [Aquirufa sp. ROCK-SH2]
MQQEILYVLLSIAIGAIIGIEREYKSKSAGLRTMILVCTGSCIFTILSIKIGVGSADRIAANILTGIGFLGAGVIFKENNRVNGITTATTIWIVSALGMSIGSGYIELAFISTFLVIVILTGLIFLQNYIEKLNQVKDYSIEFDTQEMEYEEVEALIKRNKLKVINQQWTIAKPDYTLKSTLQGSEKSHRLFTKAIMKHPRISKLQF